MLQLNLRSLESLCLLFCLFLGCTVFGQNVGINEPDPTNTLHIRPFSTGDEPLRVEGLTALTSGDNALLIHNPSVGVVRYIVLTDLSDSVWVNINNNASFLDSIVSIIFNYGDTLLSNQTFITNLQDSIDTHLDSLTFDINGNILTGWVDGNPYSVELPVLAGPQGPQGDPGVAGPQGPQGDPGPAWNILSIEYNAEGNVTINTDQPSSFTTGDRAWLTEGNLNTTAPTSPVGDPITDDYIGTNDAIDFAMATNGIERLRIKTDNNNQTRIGVGTAFTVNMNPGSTPTLMHLHDGGTTPNDYPIINLSTANTDANSATGIINFAATAATNERRSASVESYLSANSAVNVTGDLRFSTNNDNLFSEKMRILGNGNVGIGTDTPLSLLHLRGSALTMRMENPLGTTWGLNSTNAGDFRMLNFTAGPTIPLTILGANDFVGIGTTFPSTRLEINGDATLNNNIADGARFIWRGGTGGVQEYRARVGNTGTLDFFPFESSNPSYVGEVLTLTQAGFVGVGQVAPQSKLHLHDGSFIISNSTGLQSSIYTTDGGIELYRDPASAVSPTTNGYIDFKDNQADDYDVRIYYNHAIGNNGAFQIETSTNGQPGTAVGRMYILNENGRVGIGTQFPDQLLTVNGNASKPGGGNWAAFSDERVKYDITEFNDGLEELMQLRPVRYKYNDLSGFSDTSKEYIGFIAQEIENIAPYMVTSINDVEGPSGLKDKRQLDESALTKILVNSVQEQQRIILELQQKIETLTEENEQLIKSKIAVEDNIQDLKAQISEIQKLVFNQAEK